MSTIDVVVGALKRIPRVFDFAPQSSTQAEPKYGGRVTFALDGVPYTVHLYNLASGSVAELVSQEEISQPTLKKFADVSIGQAGQCHKNNSGYSAKIFLEKDLVLEEAKKLIERYRESFNNVNLKLEDSHHSLSV